MNNSVSDQNFEEIEADASSNLSYDDETTIWEGRPSQWVNFGSFIWWLIILTVAVAFLIVWNADLHEEYDPLVGTAVNYACMFLGVISILSMMHSFLSVYYEHTVVTHNKIKEAKGITRIFRQELYCEISDITDVKSPPAGILGIFGLSTLIIETKDDDQPIIRIRAIRDREHLIGQLLPIWRKLKHDRKGYFGQ